MRRAVIIDAVRTPIARAHTEKGWFKHIRSDELGIIVVTDIVRRTGIDPSHIDELIIGCANQTGEQAMNIARYIAVMAGLPYEVAAQTINRQCASSMTALHSAAQSIMTECGDVFIAGGIESMTHLPEGHGADLHPKRFDFMDPTASSMGLTAENLAEMYQISREQQEQFSLASHQRAIAAQSEGRFDAEIVPVEITEDDSSNRIVSFDQNPRPYTSLELMAALDPIAKPDGTVTAATVSFAGDGAAAAMLTSEDNAKSLGLKPKARIRSMAAAGVDPKLMGLGAVAAARKALKNAGLSIEEIDLVEINEAFATVPLVCIKELGISWDKVNPNGGAVALGHPMGCTGVRIITTLLHEMERRNLRYGMATMCTGMGQGTATILERP